jgi:hypothetical protein
MDAAGHKSGASRDGNGIGVCRDGSTERLGWSCRVCEMSFRDTSSIEDISHERRGR